MKNNKTMDYEKAYKEALERAREITKVSRGIVFKNIESVCETIFPELRESEDEKIRKELIRYLPYCDDISKDTKEKWIAWLEKQKPTEWGKEDEEMRKGIITTLKANINRLYLHDAQGKADHEAKISWLKSIKPHWKPSEEQMKENVLQELADEAKKLEE